MISNYCLRRQRGRPAFTARTAKSEGWERHTQKDAAGTGSSARLLKKSALSRGSLPILKSSRTIGDGMSGIVSLPARNDWVLSARAGSRNTGWGGWFSVTHPGRASRLSANLAIGRGFLNPRAMSLAFLKNSRAAVGCANGHKFFPSHQGGSRPLSLKCGCQRGQLWPVGYEQNDAGQSLARACSSGVAGTLASGVPAPATRANRSELACWEEGNSWGPYPCHPGDIQLTGT